MYQHHLTLEILYDQLKTTWTSVGVASLHNTLSKKTSKKTSKSKQKPVRKIDTISKDLSYDNPDNNTNLPPNFTPNRIPGNHFERIQQTRNALTKPCDFFQLFFTDDVLRTIAKHTDSYAWINIAKEPSYAKNEGAWQETDLKEIKIFIALLLYQGLIRVNRNDRY